MRFEGTLKTWNEARGSGLIAPLLGGEDVFVDASVYPPGADPVIGAPLNFEVERIGGKRRAYDVRRGAVSLLTLAPAPPSDQSVSRLRTTAPTVAAHALRAPRRGFRLPPEWGLGRIALTLAVLAALGVFGVRYYERYRSVVPAEPTRPVSAGVNPSP